MIEPTFNKSWRTRMPVPDSEWEADQVHEFDEHRLEEENIQRDWVEEEYWRHEGHEEFMAEFMNEIDQGRWDDDPSPYDGTYSEE